MLRETDQDKLPMWRSVMACPRRLSMAGRSDLVACGVALIEPGKPWQNGTNESFNGKFRDECLSIEWFRNCMEAKVVIEYWRLHYNEIRPHSSLNYQTPSEFKKTLGNYLTIGANLSM
jgi:putative transposase